MPEAPFVAAVSLALFSLGLLGLLFRRNLLILLLSLELMFNGVNLLILLGSRLHQAVEGHILVLLVIAIAACEVAVGLGIVLLLFRRRQTLDVTQYRVLRF